DRASYHSMTTSGARGAGFLVPMGFPPWPPPRWVRRGRDADPKTGTTAAEHVLRVCAEETNERPSELARPKEPNSAAAELRLALARGAGRQARGPDPDGRGDDHAGRGTPSARGKDGPAVGSRSAPPE